MDAAVRPVARLLLGALAVLGAAVVLLLVGAGSASAADDSSGPPAGQDAPGLERLVGDVSGTLDTVGTTVHDTADQVVEQTVVAVRDTVRDTVDQVVRHPDPRPQPAPEPEPIPAPSSAVTESSPPMSHGAAPTGDHGRHKPAHATRTPVVAGSSPGSATTGSSSPAPVTRTGHDVREAAAADAVPAPMSPLDHHPSDGQGNAPTGASATSVPTPGDVTGARLPADPWYGGRTALRDTRATTQHHTRPDVSPG